jgi:hypothetical protein
MHSIVTTTYNLNNAPTQKSFELIPGGSIVKVLLKIKPGGYGEFTIIEGEYKDRKVWSMIGLHSNKSDLYALSGRAFIRAIVESKRGIASRDNSPEAQQARMFKGFSELDNIVFVAKIDVTKDSKGEYRNEIRYAVTAEHPKYTDVMGEGSIASTTASNKPAVIDDEIPF